MKQACLNIVEVNHFPCKKQYCNKLYTHALNQGISPFPLGSKLNSETLGEFKVKHYRYFTQAVEIGGKVYFSSDKRNKNKPLMEFNMNDYSKLHVPSNSANLGKFFSKLPPAPTCEFGLGELNGQLVIVGGKMEERVTGKVYVFDEGAKQWRETVPPMPTPRKSPLVFSQPSCMAVIGGATSLDEKNHERIVEVFVPETSQWHKATPPPSNFRIRRTHLTHANKTCFVYNRRNGICYQLKVSVIPTSGKLFTAWRAISIPSSAHYLCLCKGVLLAVGKGEMYNLCQFSNSWKVLKYPNGIFVRNSYPCYVVVTLQSGTVLVAVYAVDGIKLFSQPSIIFYTIGCE